MLHSIVIHLNTYKILVVPGAFVAQKVAAPEIILYQKREYINRKEIEREKIEANERTVRIFAFLLNQISRSSEIGIGIFRLHQRHS